MRRRKMTANRPAERKGKGEEDQSLAKKKSNDESIQPGEWLTLEHVHRQTKAGAAATRNDFFPNELCGPGKRFPRRLNAKPRMQV